MNRESILCYAPPLTYMGQNLYNKVFDRHRVGQLPSGQYQLFIGLHLIHEVTSPQAFAMIREQNLSVPFPERTYATVDHIIPTTGEGRQRPLMDALAEGKRVVKVTRGGYSEI